MSGSPRREAGGSKDVFAGARVSISGLVRRTDLNGCVAEVGRWLEAEGRWSVTCAGAVIAVKETHLTVSHAAPCGAIGGWYEVYLNHAAAEAATCAAGALADSNSIVVQGNVASPAECAVLKAFAASNYDKLNGNVSPASWAGPGGASGTGRARLALARMGSTSFIDAEGQGLCETLLVRSLKLLDAQLPTLLKRLFGACPQTCVANAKLTFSQGEPAINIYDRGGSFDPHTDKQALTILIVLSEGDEFEGGGTAFYASDRVASDHSNLAELNGTDPSLILRPPAGCALCFGGQAVHSALRVESGRRIMLVASFT